MKIKDLRDSFVSSLSGIYDSEEVLSLFYMLTEEILELRRVDVAIHLNKKLSAEEKKKFDKAVKRLKDHEPVQYIIGKADFYGVTFRVTPHVLIPRPETEELVDWIINDQANAKDSISILDIGTGSGCIAISLAKNLPKAKVYAIDVSAEAINVAKENASKNEVDVTFVLTDILNTEELFLKFDIIVSNPPYVRELEKNEMKANVLDNEPPQALFVSDDAPLIFYKKITQLARKKLKENGVLYFEINQYLGEETKSMIEAKGYTTVIVRKDMYNNDRMIKASVN
ncbi:peptide chain release factor N(5)-glutamine methyltransferase [Aquimarina sediminis]|uniref:peptide chain release factor N(5)-glutamine methyltransferase n=1 Tax=Aquimarina sediminis TaxID=2070536 RepID=UPI000CA06B58|nr:peptide chain release factor N(5)-glutamine methyltransferase [Aquimarina sediminis]